MHRARLLAATALVALAAALPASGGEGPLPPAPENLAQSWVAYFHLSGHVFRVGDTVTGTVTIPPIGDCGKGHRCVNGFYGLVGPGLEPIGPCDMKHRTCRWKAVGETEGWQTMVMQISNDVGPAHSDDYYMVVDPNTYVLDGTVESRTSSKGVPGVRLRIAGKKRVTATTNGSGYYAVALKKGRYRITPFKAGEKGKFAPARASVVVTTKGAKRDFLLKRAFRSDFFGVTKNGGQVASGDRIGGADDEVSYVGKDWDPEGDPVQVYWNDVKLGEHSGVGEFGNKWRLPVFTDNSCRGRLKAVQGEVVKTLALRAAKAGAVVFADKDVTAGLFRGDRVDAVSGARRLRSKAVLCEGEGASVGAKGAAIWVTDTAFFVENRPKGVRIRGTVSSPAAAMALSGGRSISFAVRGADPRSYDTAGKGLVQQIPGTVEGSPVFNGLLRGTGSVRVTGPLRLDGAVLFVDGDLMLEQGVSGVGAIIATGSVTVRGPVDLVTDNIVAMLAGGNLLLYGK